MLTAYDVTLLFPAEYADFRSAASHFLIFEESSLLEFCLRSKKLNHSSFRIQKIQTTISPQGGKSAKIRPDISEDFSSAKICEICGNPAPDSVDRRPLTVDSPFTSSLSCILQPSSAHYRIEPIVFRLPLQKFLIHP